MRRTLAGLLALGLLATLPVGAASAAPSQAPGCDVVDAELTWGFKDTFRAYIDGSIANGEWTVADGATYETPYFGFAGEGGRVDPRDPNGSVDFAGSVRFTGHGGVLDTTIADPVLVLRGDGTGMILLDVSGPTMAGDPVDEREVPFATVDLGGQDFSVVEGILTIENAPTTLTAEGSAAFPNYPAGEALDPITATIDLGGCELTGQPIGTDVIDDFPMGNATVWIGLIVGAVVLLAAILVVLLVVRRRP